MLRIGNSMYRIISRGNTKYLINGLNAGDDIDDDTDDSLWEKSDYVMEVKKSKGSTLDEWFVNKGGKFK